MQVESPISRAAWRNGERNKAMKAKSTTIRVYWMIERVGIPMFSSQSWNEKRRNASKTALVLVPVCFRIYVPPVKRNLTMCTHYTLSLTG